MPSVLKRPLSVRASEDWKRSLDAPAIRAQNQSRLVHERNGSRSGLKVRTVIFPRPRLASIASGFAVEPMETTPSSNLPVTIGNGAVSKLLSARISAFANDAGFLFVALKVPFTVGVF